MKSRSIQGTATLTLWIIAVFQLPAVGRADPPAAGRSRFAELWTGETAYSEPELLALSGDADPVARQFACLRLAELDPPSEAVLAALFRSLEDPVDLVRFQALAGLMRLGRPATRILAAALSDLEPIGEIDYESEAANDRRSLPLSRSDLAFTALIHARDIDVDALLSTYPATPSEEETSVEEPADLLVFSESPSASPRKRIRMVLEQAPGPFSASLYAALQEGDDAPLRITAARIIGRTGADAVPHLAKVVAEDGDASVRDAAAYTLAQIPESGPQALRSLLEQADSKTRRAALAAYPASAGDSAELVTRFLEDSEREVQRTALDRIRDPELPPRAPAHHYRYGQPCWRAVDGGKPPSALLAGLPAAVLPGVVAFARDADAKTRVAAVEALGSLGCTRRDLASAVADALAPMLSDPVEEVADSATHQLSMLAELSSSPRSPEALDQLLRGLARPARKGEHYEMLTVLKHMDLPESRREELIDLLVTACLGDSGLCGYVKEILRRPGWQEAEAESLAVRYPDVRSLDGETARALEALGLEGPSAINLLERLLEHPEQRVRVKAALALARQGQASGRVWEALEEGAQSQGGWSLEAAEALAASGEQGVARLVAILRDPATPWLARYELVSRVLPRVADESSGSANFLLATAVDPADPRIQAAAVRGLRSLEPGARAIEVRAALETAFSNGNAEVRRAVVFVWDSSGLAPGDLVVRAFADPEPAVRKAAFELLPLLPENDPRPVQLTAASLRDENDDVRDKALQFAGKLGEPGAAFLAQYLASGGPITDGFVEGVEHLSSIGGALAAALEARAAGASTEEQLLIADLLRRSGAQAPVDREPLYSQLEASNPEVRENAAHELLSLEEDPWDRGGLLAAVLMDSEVRKVVQRRLGTALDRLAPPSYMNLSGRFTVPRFPWPPPPGSRRVVVPRELLAVSATTTFGDIYKRLVGAIEAASPSKAFEHGLFLGPPDGFVLMARMERIKRDGTPLPEPARWMKEGSPKLDLLDFFADLFFENPGYFRVIVFAVTSNLMPGENPSASLPEPKAGAPGMPDELAVKLFGNKEVLALVYTFERRRDAKITPEHWDGAPSARQHLEKAGVWSGLGPASTRRGGK